MAFDPRPGCPGLTRKLLAVGGDVKAYWEIFDLRGGELLAVERGLHPVLAHLIPMRRCNLACGYCNEYDHTSSPVPVELIKRRIDKLGALGTSIVTISGGEPMMHPELDDIIHQIRSHGIDCRAYLQRLLLYAG